MSKSVSTNQVNLCRPNPWNRALVEAPLHTIGKNGNVEAAKWLVEKGANVRMLNSFAQTPLMLACERGHLALASFLLDSRPGEGGDLSVVAFGGFTSLHLAASRAQSEACTWVLQKLPTAAEQQSAVATKDNHGDTPFLLACLSGNLDTCRNLFKFSGLWRGSSAHRTPNQGQLPKWALEVLKKRAAKTKRSSHKDEGNSDGHVKSVSAQNETYADPSGGGHLTVKEEGAGMAIADVESWVLAETRRRENFLASHVNKDGTTLLHAAALGGNPAVVRWVIDKVVASTAATAAAAAVAAALVCSPSPTATAATTASPASSAGAAAMPHNDLTTRRWLHTLDANGERPLLVASHWGHAAACAELVMAGALVSSGDDDSSNLNSFAERALIDVGIFGRDLPVHTPASSSCTETAPGHGDRGNNGGDDVVDDDDDAVALLLDPFSPEAAGARGHRPRRVLGGVPAASSSSSPSGRNKKTHGRQGNQAESNAELEALKLAADRAWEEAAATTPKAGDVRRWLQEWAEKELKSAQSFPASFLMGTLKRPKQKGAAVFRGGNGVGGAARRQQEPPPAATIQRESSHEEDAQPLAALPASRGECFIPLLRKAERRVKHRPRQLIADFAGVVWGRRRRLVREILVHLDGHLGE